MFMESINQYDVFYNTADRKNRMIGISLDLSYFLRLN